MESVSICFFRAASSSDARFPSQMRPTMMIPCSFAAALIVSRYGLSYDFIQMSFNVTPFMPRSFMSFITVTMSYCPPFISSLML
jgi:hypothetical protein